MHGVDWIIWLCITVSDATFIEAIAFGFALPWVPTILVLTIAQALGSLFD